MTRVRALQWDGGALELFDQRQLPNRVAWVRCVTPAEVAEAIAGLVVRGAPAIGVAAAYGLVLAARMDPTPGGLRNGADQLRQARPTAVNLSWAVDFVLQRALRASPATRERAALEAAERIHRQDAAACRQLARHGADIVGERGPCEVLTHCNTGALATAGIGTALGIVRVLADRGKLRRVWACEARPVLQGARLTAWEGVHDDLPMTLITDSAAGGVLRDREISAVVLGADRIAADGGVANKVGTYPLAVLARHHGVQFYVAAPTSTVDLETARCHDIPIEERDGDEVRSLAGATIAPAEIAVFNPAFDVTPPELVTAIITERGVARPPYAASLADLVVGEDV